MTEQEKIVLIAQNYLDELSKDAERHIPFRFSISERANNQRRMRAAEDMFAANAELICKFILASVKKELPDEQ